MLLSLVAAFTVLGPTLLHAYSVSPMRFELRPSGSDSQTTMTIENSNAFPVTLEVRPYEISIGEDGKEVLTSSEDDFLIFPPQMIIQSGKEQTLRIKYIGDPAIERSKSYRVRVEQIAIDMSGNQSAGVALALNFSTLAAVVPEGASPDLRVVGLAPTPDGRLEVTVENVGDAYARLAATQWQLTNGDQTTQVPGGAVSNMNDEVAAVFLPGVSQTLVLDLPDSFDAAGTEVALALR